MKETHYQRNKEKYNRRSKAWVTAHPRRVRKIKAKARAKRRAWVASFKDRSCVDCGVKYPPYVMQFDHVRGRKLFTISLRVDYSASRVLREIAKCDVVCANCHAERTHKRRS